MEKTTTPATTERVARIIEKFNRDGGGQRVATVDSTDIQARTVTLAFSSESPVERWFGIEILGHRPEEVRLDRLRGNGPLLMDHNVMDQVGVVETASVDGDGVARATVRFGKSPRAEEILQDVNDRIRRNVSVGYRINAMELVGVKDDVEMWRAVDWEPYEISIVAVPADTTVGVGRAQSADTVETPEKSGDDAKIDDSTREAETEKDPEVIMTDVNENAGSARPAANDNERERALKMERERVATIMELGREYDALDLANEHISNPNGSETSMLRALQGRTGISPPVKPQTSDIGMTPQDLKKFSVVKIARALVYPNDRKIQEEAAFEREMSDAARQNQNNTNTGRWIVPSDVLRTNPRGMNSLYRDGDMNVGDNNQTGPGSTGGATVTTWLEANSYIAMLRNKAKFATGIKMLAGLRGIVDIPKQTAFTQGYWVGEGEPVGKTSMDFNTLELKPRTAGAYVDITRRFLMQTSVDIEMLIRSDLATTMALLIDRSGYYGTGTEKQPRGLANMDGMPITEYDGNFPSYEQLVDAETAVANKNADVESMRFKATPGFRGYAKKTLEFDVNGSNKIWEPGGTVNGYACDITNQIDNGDVFFGNYGDVLMGMWGGLELHVDPYTNSTSGDVRLITFQDIDWQVRRTESFMILRRKGTQAATQNGGDNDNGASSKKKSA